MAFCMNSRLWRLLKWIAMSCKVIPCHEKNYFLTKQKKFAILKTFGLDCICSPSLLRMFGLQGPLRVTSKLCNSSGWGYWCPHIMLNLFIRNNTSGVYWNQRINVLIWPCCWTAGGSEESSCSLWSVSWCCVKRLLVQVESLICCFC